MQVSPTIASIPPREELPPIPYCADCRYWHGVAYFGIPLHCPHFPEGWDWHEAPCPEHEDMIEIR